MADRPKLGIRCPDDRRVTITNEGALFRVKVKPPLPEADLDATFADHRAARGHAGGLRLIHRWPIEDLTEEGQRA